MKDPAFVRAYDSIAPDDAVRERIRSAVRTQTAHKHRSFPLRRTLWIIAAAISLLSMLTICGYAAWQWMLPAPTYYDSSRGDVIIRSEQYFASLPAADPAELTDEAFLTRSQELLAAVGLPQPENAEARVIRQENLLFARNEVVVRIGSEPACDTVTFNADTGAVLQLHSSNNDEWSSKDAPDRELDIDALVQQYSTLLTGRTGYTVVEDISSSDHLITLHAYSTVLDGVVNPCDSIMLVISPRTGALLLCGVFHTPLIDDADTGAIPITMEEAKAIAESGIADLSKSEAHMGSFDRFRFSDAELTVVCPDWSFTGMVDRENGSLQIPDFARLAWVVSYTRESDVYEQHYRYEFWIDYYTGQLLGGAALEAV